MAVATTTTFSALIKELWPQREIYDLLYYNMPFYALVRKTTNMNQKTHIAAGYETTQGVSGDFASAKANKQPTSEAGFAITPVTTYSIASIDRLLIRATRGDQRAIVDALDRQTQQALLAWKFELATLLWGNGGGALAQVNAVSGANIDLVNVDDIVKFSRNMTLQVSSDDGSGSSPAAVRSGSAVVGKVNRNRGAAHQLVAQTGNWTDAGNIPGLIANDYLFRSGNNANVVSGVGAWLPSTDPASGDSFFGQDRSTDPLRLAGIRVSATNSTPREAAMIGIVEVVRNSGAPSHYFVNPSDFENLQLEMQGAGALVQIKEPAAPIGSHTFGEPFDGIGIMGPKGTVRVFADDRVGTPPGSTGSVGYLMQLDTWTLGGIGEFPYIVAEDGLRIAREELADSFEIRIVGDYNLYCEAPGFNARVAF